MVRKILIYTFLMGLFAGCNKDNTRIKVPLIVLDPEVEIISSGINDILDDPEFYYFIVNMNANPSTQFGGLLNKANYEVGGNLAVKAQWKNDTFEIGGDGFYFENWGSVVEITNFSDSWELHVDPKDDGQVPWSSGDSILITIKGEVTMNLSTDPETTISDSYEIYEQDFLYVQ